LDLIHRILLVCACFRTFQAFWEFVRNWLSSGGDGAIDMRPPRGNKVGRKPGVPNRMTRIIKEATFAAVELSKYSNGQGLVGYLKWLSEEHPRTFARSILGRLIPLQYRLNAEVVARTESVDEIRAKLRDRGIPIDKLDRLFDLPKLPAPLPDPPRAEPAPPLSTSSLSEEATTTRRDERLNLRLVNSAGDE
jgi:hypothetical protein